MDAYLNNRQKDILSQLLANPADNGNAYASNLQELANQYPQSGIFRALLSRARAEQAPAQSAAWFSSGALHKLYYHPTDLTPVSEGQIVFQQLQVKLQPPAAQPVKTGTEAAPEPEQQAAMPDELPLEPPAIWNMEQPGQQEASALPGDDFKWPPVDADDDNDHNKEELSNNWPQPETELSQPEYKPNVAANDEQPVVFTPPVENVFNKESHIEDEVYDEITGIDHIDIPETAKAGSGLPDVDDLLENDQPDAENSPADTSHSGQASSKDFFVLDGGHQGKEQDNALPVASDIMSPAVQASADEHQDISKYHDEQMPYTFMWWLDKTRKEHSRLYRPYAKTPATGTAKLAKPAVADELQQQYYENIFHITSIDEFGNDTGETQQISFDLQRKEDVIIERFIKEDPHIQPPTGERLDTENKARRSSEDSDEMVTETLARIYVDQMLYPKAIATYKKLMLKFPEKSTYFASRIEKLERKTY